MIVRPANKEDWDQLVLLNKKHNFPFPDFNNMLDVLVIEEDGLIKAWGYTKKFVEVVFVPDKDQPPKTIVKSLKMLVEKSTELTRERGIDQIHAFVTDENFATILLKHFNYGIVTGTPLYFNIDQNG